METYLAASLLAAGTAWRLKQANHVRLTILQLAFAAIFLLGAMEEISWVQRLFDWDTPVALDAANRQEETTLQM